jgi:Flp pilus assembly protein TadB
MNATVAVAALVSGVVAALPGALRALLGRRVRARARAAGVPLERARESQSESRSQPGRGRLGGCATGRGRRRSRESAALTAAVVRAGTALLLGAGVAVSLDGWSGPLVGVLVAVLSCRYLPALPTADERRAAVQAAALRSQLPLTADLLAGCLASWCAPDAAAEAVGAAVGEPMASRLAEVAADLRTGVGAEESWARFGADPVLAPLGRCLVRASASGAPPAAGLARLAENCRASAAVAAQARARRAGVLATAPLGLCFLPAFVLIGVVPVVTGLAGSFLVRA